MKLNDWKNFLKNKNAANKITAGVKENGKMNDSLKKGAQNQRHTSSYRTVCTDPRVSVKNLFLIICQPNNFNLKYTSFYRHHRMID